MQGKRYKKYTPLAILAIVLFLISFGVVGRLIPHLWSMTPIVAIGLLSFHYIDKRFAWAVPILALVISDIFLGFYDIKLLLIVYGSFGVVTLSGSFISGRGIKRVAGIIIAPLLASTFFFLVTNWAVWQFSPWYGHDFAGLMNSYIAGLPFFRNMLVGDLVFTVALFGAFEYLPVFFKKLLRNRGKIYYPAIEYPATYYQAQKGKLITRNTYKYNLQKSL